MEVLGITVPSEFLLLLASKLICVDLSERSSTMDCFSTNIEHDQLVALKEMGVTIQAGLLVPMVSVPDKRIALPRQT